jgi:hypothetical protein
MSMSLGCSESVQVLGSLMRHLPLVEPMGVYWKRTSGASRAKITASFWYSAEAREEPAADITVCATAG